MTYYALVMILTLNSNITTIQKYDTFTTKKDCLTIAKQRDRKLKNNPEFMKNVKVLEMLCFEKLE